MPRAYNKPEFGPCAPVAAALLTDWVNRHRLDMGAESAYTTEFLDGAEKPAEGRHHCKQEKGHAQRHVQQA